MSIELPDYWEFEPTQVEQRIKHIEEKLVELETTLKITLENVDKLTDLFREYENSSHGYPKKGTLIW